MVTQIDRRRPHERWKRAKAEFIDMTTLHGLRRAGDMSGRVTPLRRYIWGLFITMGLGAIIIITLDQVREFWRHPTSTRISVINSNKPLQFPAVTICSLNRFYSNENMTYEDRIGIYSYDIAELCYSEDVSFENVEGEILRSISSTYTEKKEYGELITKYKKCVKLPKGKSNMLEALQKIKCKHYKKNEIETLFKKYGFNIRSALIECRMGNGLARKCVAADFIPTYSTTHGLCWTLNGNASNRIWKQKIGGINGGLKLELYNPQKKFMTRKVQNSPIGAGLKIILHEPYEPPKVDDHGFFVGPGFHTFAQIEMTKEDHVKLSDSSCRDTKLGNVTYTERLAEKTCKQNLSMEICGCVPPTYAGNKNRTCDLSVLAICMYKLKWNSTKDSNHTSSSDEWAACKQRPACKKTTYKASLSSVVWPSLPDLQEYHKVLNLTKEELTEDFVILDIYFPELKYHEIKEVTLIYFTNLLSKFGGTLGLFLGASILTMMELLEMSLFYCRRRVECTKNTLQEWRSLPRLRTVDTTPNTSATNLVDNRNENAAR